MKGPPLITSSFSNLIQKVGPAGPAARRVEQIFCVVKFRQNMFVGLDPLLLRKLPLLFDENRIPADPLRRTGLADEHVPPGTVVVVLEVANPERTFVM